MLQDPRNWSTSIGTLHAFDVMCCSRYGRVEELVEMLRFVCELNQSEDGRKQMRRINCLFYDSKANQLIIMNDYFWTVGHLAYGAEVVHKVAIKHFPQWSFQIDDEVVVTELGEFTGRGPINVDSDRHQAG